MCEFHEWKERLLERLCLIPVKTALRLTNVKDECVTTNLLLGWHDESMRKTSGWMLTLTEKPRKRSKIVAVKKQGFPRRRSGFENYERTVRKTSGHQYNWPAGGHLCWRLHEFKTIRKERQHRNQGRGILHWCNCRLTAGVRMSCALCV